MTTEFSNKNFKGLFFDLLSTGNKTLAGYKKVVAPYMGQWLKTTDKLFELRYGTYECESWVICYKQKPTEWYDSSKGRGHIFRRQSIGIHYPIFNHGCAFMYGQIGVGKKKSFFQFYSACGNELGYDFWFPNEDLNKVKKFIMEHKNDHDFALQLTEMKNSYGY